MDVCLWWLFRQFLFSVIPREYSTTALDSRPIKTEVIRNRNSKDFWAYRCFPTKVLVFCSWSPAGTHQVLVSGLILQRSWVQHRPSVWMDLESAWKSEDVSCSQSLVMPFPAEDFGLTTGDETFSILFLQAVTSSGSVANQVPNRNCRIHYCSFNLKMQA